mmetsp:Transcript_12032/g.38100  ORF Transcript_12032/g.38100 Transcript_12032/m.38100 type:complete len:118 (+) Transcript_12032:449-802(+)
MSRGPTALPEDKWGETAPHPSLAPGRAGEKDEGDEGGGERADPGRDMELVERIARHVGWETEHVWLLLLLVFLGGMLVLAWNQLAMMRSMYADFAGYSDSGGGSVVREIKGGGRDEL